jgi:serine/threonine-protein kinase
MPSKRNQRARCFRVLYPPLDYDYAQDGPQPGTEIGEFTLQENLGGGQAAVLKVVRRSDNCVFALRIPWEQSDERRTRIAADQLRVHCINDGSIPRQYGIVDIPNGPFGALWEFVDGENVCRHADRHALTIHKRLRLFQRLCSSVGSIHRLGLVHCDLKPENTTVNHSKRVCLLDLGGMVEAGTMISPEHAATEGYRAPERDQDCIARPSTDVYSLGMMLSELLVGERIMPGETLSQALARNQNTLKCRSRLRRRTSVSLERRMIGRLNEIVCKATHVDESNRMTDADSLRAAVRACL